MLKSYLSKRVALLQLGAKDEDLPLSPELEKAATETVGPESAPGESEGDGTVDADISLLDDPESPE
jgi:hypothetical protein